MAQPRFKAMTLEELTKSKDWAWKTRVPPSTSAKEDAGTQHSGLEASPEPVAAGSPHVAKIGSEDRESVNAHASGNSTANIKPIAPTSEQFLSHLRRDSTQSKDTEAFIFCTTPKVARASVKIGSTDAQRASTASQPKPANSWQQSSLDSAAAHDKAKGEVKAESGSDGKAKDPMEDLSTQVRSGLTISSKTASSISKNSTEKTAIANDSSPVDTVNSYHDAFNQPIPLTPHTVASQHPMHHSLDRNGPAGAITARDILYAMHQETKALFEGDNGRWQKHESVILKHFWDMSQEYYGGK